MSGLDGRPTRHVVFNPSARASLIEALKILGRRDDVVALFDDLRCAPLDLSDLPARGRWFDEVLRVDFEAGLVIQWHEDFWPKAIDPGCRLVAWTTRYAAQDWIGFLAWASRLGETPADVVNISDVLFEDPDWGNLSARRRKCVPLLTPTDFVERRLVDLARPLGSDERAEARTEFAQLVEESGAFRAVRDGQLTSLPITAYDDRLIGASAPNFRKAARVIGTVLVDMAEREGWPTSDLTLAARLCALVEARRLEAVGDIYGSIRYWEVRLPQSEP